MEVEYSYVTCRNALSKSRLPGLDYSLNPYYGCEHGCRYCYAPSVLRAPPTAAWGGFVKAKRNIVEVLKHELERKTPGVVGLSTVTDPYQPAERWMRLTRSCLELISETPFKLSLQTKSILFLRDLALMDKSKDDVGVTITTLDESAAALLEPHAPSPGERIWALREASSKGFDTWIFLGPIIPGVNDDREGITRLVEAARRVESKLLYDKINLRSGVLESLTPLLEELNPGSKGRVGEVLKREADYWRNLSSFIQDRCRRLGVECEAAFKTPNLEEVYTRVPQLRFQP